MIRRKAWIGFACLLVLSSSPVAARFLGKDADRLIRDGQELAMRGKHAEALELFDQLLRLRPAHPAAYFYQAAVWERWMDDQQDYSAEDRFYALADSAIERGERMAAAGSSDPWVYVFLGATHGLKGVYEAQRNRWWSALKNGWLGVSRLKESLSMDPELYDAYVGIGTYLYWRSRWTKHLTVLPFVKDDREEGIRLLRTAAQQSRYSRAGAKCQLLWILLREEQLAEALEIGDELYARYPNSAVVLFGYATALSRSGRLREAERVYADALTTYERMGKAHPYALECRWGLAKIYAQRRDMPAAEAECQKILQHNRAHPGPAWSERKIKQVRKLLLEARRRP